jgi:hypothetical protein
MPMPGVHNANSADAKSCAADFRRYERPICAAFEIFTGKTVSSFSGRFSPLPTATTVMDHKDIERQVTGRTRSFRK